MEYKIEKIQQTYEEFLEELTTSTQAQLEKKYIGKKGIIKDLLLEISKQPDNQRASYGKEVNLFKTFLEEKLGQLKVKSISDTLSTSIDPTAPFDINTSIAKRPKTKRRNGSIHPLMSEMKYVLDNFQKMGFEIVESRQLDDDYHMFESLNFPVGHPARDMYDSFWTQEKLTPPAHTSTMQNRIMRERKPPIRVVIPGRCFRHEATDASHDIAFRQLEGLMVGENISIANLIAVMKVALKGIFQKEVRVRLRPGYFPFVEPGFEMDMGCLICNGVGCSVCKQVGWLEILGCGLIHPNVLKAGGVDPKKYSGFAFGVGLTRLVMMRYGIEDIRYLNSGDLRFLKQF